nr:protein ROOT INITIATION DEFECTIVE 3-like isoform X2 [Populus alba]
MTGRLLKKWRAHYRTVTCLVFTEDDSLLVSGSEDVSVRVWSLLVIFDDYQTEQASTLYEHSFQEHILRVTDMVTEMARYTLLRSMLLAHLAKVTGCISSVHYLVTANGVLEPAMLSNAQASSRRHGSSLPPPLNKYINTTDEKIVTQ